MSKTSLPLIAFALLAHFHTPFFAMFLLIVATLNSPANYFLALYAQSLNRTRNLNLTVRVLRVGALTRSALKRCLLKFSFVSLNYELEKIC